MKKQDFLVKIEEDETLIGPTHPKAELIGRVFGNCLCKSSSNIWRCAKCGCAISINEGVEDKDGNKYCDDCGKNC